MQTELALDSAAHLVFELIPLQAHEQIAHDSALARAENFAHAASELLVSIEEIDRLRIFEKFGLRSSLAYCIQYLKLTEDIAINFITVARKTRVSPVLKEAIERKELDVSKARRICSVLTPENESEWVEKAKELSKAQLEKEVACVSPKAASRSMTKPVGPNRTKFQFEASDAFVKNYRRAQDLESQRLAKSVDIDETLMAALEVYLDAHDPVRKAERARERGGKHPARAVRSPKASSAKAKNSDSETDQGVKPESDPARAVQKTRTPIPTKNSHEANLRDRGECRALLPDGTPCRATRWTDLHHIRPLSEGGTHDVENLITLCKAHHRQWHKLHQV